MLGLNIDFSFEELSKFGFGEPQEPLGGTRVPGRGTACRGPDHTVLYLKSKNPKGKPGWGKTRNGKGLKEKHQQKQNTKCKRNDQKCII